MKIIIVAMIAAGLLTSAVALPAAAQGVWNVCPEGVTNSSAICGDDSDATDIVMLLIDAFLFVIGILSVIMIIHSGFKYINSRGDPEQVKSAKNTLLYAVIGLIVAMLAFVIVNFVIGIFLQSDDGSTAGRTAIGRGISA